MAKLLAGLLLVVVSLAVLKALVPLLLAGGDAVVPLAIVACFIRLTWYVTNRY